MQELSAQELVLAVVIAVCERKSQSRLRDRRQSKIIDDCRELMNDPAICPKVRRISASPYDLSMAVRSPTCEEAGEIFDRIEPAVRVLVKRL
jgi:hypothetical protein